MLVSAKERVPLARLLTFLEHGERVAHDCARAQAALVPEPTVRRFLLNQARQEAFHAVVFQGAAAWLVPRHLGAIPLLQPLEEYRRRLEDAVARRDLAETFLAEQVILEGLGETILARIERGLARRSAPFARLRRLLLHQEEAHHAFGHRALERMLSGSGCVQDELRSRAADYLGLVEEIVAGAGDLLASIDENPSAYLPDPQRLLPAWLATPE